MGEFGCWKEDTEAGGNMKKKVKQKVCFAASSGGHLEQLMMLRPLMERYDSFIVTEKTKYQPDLKGVRAYRLPQVNRRERTASVRLLAGVLLSFEIFLRERPDAVICTGALATIPICLLCKLFGRKVVYIESFAKVDSGNLSGKLLYRFADQFYVQWENMLKVYPGAIYLGGIY